MATISIIVAIDENNAIGKNGGMLCHLPNDLKYFKKVTLGHPVIMGRRTFDSLPNGALPGRQNIVITGNKCFRAEGVDTVSSLHDALLLVDVENEAFIIGGGMVYKESMAFADKLYITRIQVSEKNMHT